MLAGMSAPDSGPRRCPNCHAVATHHFCPKCGQPTTGWRAGLGDLVHEFVSATLGADARIWVSLRELFRRPGALTVAYFEGRRFRFLAPLRMYLFASVFMFMVFAMITALTSSNLSLQLNGPAFKISTADGGATDSENRIANTEGEQQLGNGFEKTLTENFVQSDLWFLSWLGTNLMSWARHMDSMSKEELERAILSHLNSFAPTALFLFLPFLAAILRFVYWILPFLRKIRRALLWPFVWTFAHLPRRPTRKSKSANGAKAARKEAAIAAERQSKSLYFDHFIFSLHFMTFLYLFVTAQKIIAAQPLVPVPTILMVLVSLIYPPFYFVRAQQRISGFRTSTVFSTSVLSFVLAIPVALALAGLLLLVSALNA